MWIFVQENHHLFLESQNHRYSITVKFMTDCALAQAYQTLSKRDSDAAETGDNAVRFESDDCRCGGSEGHG
jgi:hypothetical protein